MDNCPYCNKEIDVYQEYSDNGGVDKQFNIECPYCGKGIEVNVEFNEPEFQLIKVDDETQSEE